MHTKNRASNPLEFFRPTITFSSARVAFKALLKTLNVTENDCILLPAFVGYSAREGSGVLDPVTEIGSKYTFYRVRRDLTIDLDHLHEQLAKSRPKLLVLIHYYGYPDKNVHEAVSMARNYGTIIVEDEAHALYSDWIGGACGRFGDACIMSLHKMFPVAQGGLLVINPSLEQAPEVAQRCTMLQEPIEFNPLNYDLFAISSIRRSNSLLLQTMLQPLQGRVDPLYPVLPEGVVPQTFPVLITGRSRDQLYFELNDLGHGVVSLYHTMVSAIEPNMFPDSYWLAQHVLNLPIHQEVEVNNLKLLVETLSTLLPK